VAPVTYICEEEPARYRAMMEALEEGAEDAENLRRLEASSPDGSLSSG